MDPSSPRPTPESPSTHACDGPDVAESDDTPGSGYITMNIVDSFGMFSNINQLVVLLIQGCRLSSSTYPHPTAIWLCQRSTRSKWMSRRVAPETSRRRFIENSRRLSANSTRVPKFQHAGHGKKTLPCSQCKYSRVIIVYILNKCAASVPPVPRTTVQYGLRRLPGNLAQG